MATERQIMDAGKAVALALKSGAIRKPDRCQKCKRKEISRNIHGHHHDYSKPLEVFWVCRECHRGIHMILNWLRLCHDWLKHCNSEGVDPKEANLPCLHSKTGKQLQSTHFEYWKRFRRTRKQA